MYLPQAKVYDGSCALGPVITLADAMPAPDEIVIRMVIRREGKVEFEGGTTTGQMARSFSELIGWLKRDNSFPDGAILLTGTGIVPADDFTLAPLDSVEITIEGIGTLRNFVVQQTRDDWITFIASDFMVQPVLIDGHMAGIARTTRRFARKIRQRGSH